MFRIVIGGLTIVGLITGLYFGLDDANENERGASGRSLRCQYGYDLVNGKCTDINECIENKGNDLYTRNLK